LTNLLTFSPENQGVFSYNVILQ